MRLAVVKCHVAFCYCPALRKSNFTVAKQYRNFKNQLFFPEFMPAALKKVSVPRPDHQDDMVYAKVLAEDIGNVAIPDWQDLNAEMVLEMEKSSCHLIPFQSVKHYVEEGTVQLL
ncbi:hypothetical protein B9Z55_021760 [Caenorhabditis nigoni]|uniref:DNA replication complex GINS protein SLD5 C-terminal domain-containing protein n=1 Tax=Caenorhabditis nigoni TaxID=1611254 RepID=A0A2G5TTC2_9PELO|nr:hypothetical protein B9Z55_021760 [Caenorhabditis nigoni]